MEKIEMKRFTEFRYNSLAGKVQMIFGALLLAVLTLLGVFIHWFVEENLRERNEAELSNATASVYKMMEIYVELAVLVDLTGLEKKINALKIGESGYSFIVDIRGNLVIDRRRKGDNIIGERDPDGKYHIREIIENRRKAGVINYKSIDPDGEPILMLASYRYFPKKEWIVVSCMSLEKSEDILNKISFATIAVIIASCIGNYLIVALIFYRLLKPVSHMREVSNAVSNGDLTRRLKVISKDEIGEVASHLNASIDGFEIILKKIKTTSAALVESVGNLSVSSQEISTTSNQQSASVREIVTTMEDSDQLARNIAQRIDEVARIANDTKEVVSHGFSTIGDSFKKMEEIRDSNNERIAVIKSLGEKIDTIWEIVNIINSIADQTRIIAFNAELEASAAGDAGKNFNIVASEIRRLADSTVASTAEIKARINEIQHSSDRLVLASEEGTRKISEGWELSNDLNKVFEDIQQSSEKSAESAEKIVQSVNHQVSAFEQILQTLKQISEGIDSFVVSTRSTKGASENLQETADSLNTLIKAYKVSKDQYKGV